MEELELQGKIIKSIDIDGHGILLATEDGYRLEYWASDGGYSSWSIEQEGQSERETM